jgi:predicted ArsR family transcriptional regulator
MLAWGTKHVKIAVTLILVVMLLDSTFVVSVLLQVQSHTPGRSVRANDNRSSLLFVTPFGDWGFADGQSLSTNMSTQGEIMAYISSNPGVYLREVSGDLGLPMGVVQYHIWVLMKSGQIEDFRSGRYRRFFSAARYGELERKVISQLKQGTAGRILTLLAEGKSLDHTRLAALLGITSQGLTWQMNRLKTLGLVESVTVNHRPERLYTLTDAVFTVVQRFGNLTPRLARLLQVPSVR